MSSEGIPQTRVGVGVLVFRTLSNAGAGVDHHIEGTREKGAGIVSHFGAVEVLISKRIKETSLGYGEWALPGGLLEFGESFEECAARELYEETGIVARDQDIVPQFEYAVNTVFDDENQCVTIFMSARIPRDVVIENKEPEKHSDWVFVPWEEICSQNNPTYLPLFTPLKTLCDVCRVATNE